MACLEIKVRSSALEQHIARSVVLWHDYLCMYVSTRGRDVVTGQLLEIALDSLSLDGVFQYHCPITIPLPRVHLVCSISIRC